MSETPYVTEVPAWVPACILREADAIRAMATPAYNPQVLNRLVTDEAMRSVWSYLTQRDRQTGDYKHPARHQEGSRQRTRDEAQDAALEETLLTAYLATVEKRRVGKLSEAHAAKKKYAERSVMLRDLADEMFRSAEAYAHLPSHAQTVKDTANSAACLRWAALWCDAQVPLIRDETDPMTVIKFTGDPEASGIQITIALFLKDRFGEHLHGIAAKITQVALGLANPPKAKLSRYAT